MQIREKFVFFGMFPLGSLYISKTSWEKFPFSSIQGRVIFVNIRNDVFQTPSKFSINVDDTLLFQIRKIHDFVLTHTHQHIKRRIESHHPSDDDEVWAFHVPDILLFEFLEKGTTTLFAASQLCIYATMICWFDEYGVNDKKLSSHGRELSIEELTYSVHSKTPWHELATNDRFAISKKSELKHVIMI